MKTIEEEKLCIKKIIKIEIAILTLATVIFGIFYGITTSQWLTALIFSLVSQGFIQLMAFLANMKAQNCLERYY